MNRVRSGLLWLLLLAINAGALAGEVLTEVFRSEAIGRDYKYTVYLPDSYKKDERRYPVLYLLHGAGATRTNGWPPAACAPPWMQ